jgi:hypothetical protein
VCGTRFAHAAAGVLPQLDSAELRKVFDNFDLNSSGTLDMKVTAAPCMPNINITIFIIVSATNLRFG